MFISVPQSIDTALFQIVQLVCECLTTSMYCHGIGNDDSFGTSDCSLGMTMVAINKFP